MPTTMLPRTYSTRAVVEATGLTYRQVDYLARTDVLRPSAADAAGSGSRRLYDEDDLAVLHVVAVLCRLGARHDALRTAVVHLRLLRDLDDWTGSVLVSEDGHVYAGANTPGSGAGWYVDLDRLPSTP